VTPKKILQEAHVVTSKPSSSQPLSGRRILVTRAEHQAGRLSHILASLGAEPVEVPAIRILPPDTYEPLDHALRTLSSYDWIILTSANTVNAMLSRIEQLGMVSPASQTGQAIYGPMPKIAAVGPSTAKAAARVRWNIDLMPDKYVAESLLEALGDKLRGQRVLLARSSRSRDVIPEALREQGVNLDVVEAYRTEIPEESLAQIRTLFGDGRPHGLAAATFTSSSTVDNFFKLMRASGLAFVPSTLPAISIGPITSKTLRDHAWEPSAEADPHSVDGLVDAVVRTLSR